MGSEVSIMTGHVDERTVDDTPVEVAYSVSDAGHSKVVLRFGHDAYTTNDADFLDEYIAALEAVRDRLISGE